MKRPNIPADARRSLGSIPSRAGELTAMQYFTGNALQDGDRCTLTAVQLAMVCATAAHVAVTLAQSREATK